VTSAPAAIRSAVRRANLRFFCSTEKRLGEAQGEGLTVKEAEEEEAEQISAATEAVSSAPTA
jgi:hypothetical protein